MSAKTVCAVAFFLVTGLTLVVPSFPPAELMYNLLRVSINPMSFLGISVPTLLYGLSNGFFWLVVGAGVYGLASYLSRGEPLPPMPEPPHLKTPLPEPTPVDSRVSNVPPAFTVRVVTKPRLVAARKVAKRRLEYDIEMIEGIGSIRGATLRNLGVKTVDDLLKASASKLTLYKIAKELGVLDETVLKWVSRGDLLRVRGVGRQYSELLESAGVTSVVDLSTRNAGYLHQTLKGINREKSLVRRVPPAETVQIWVNNARMLEPLVER